LAAEAAAAPFVSPTTFRRISATNTSQLTIPARIGYRHVLYDVFQTGAPFYSYIDVAVGTRVFIRLPIQAANCYVILQPGQKRNGKGFLWGLSDLFGAEHLPNAAEDEDINITVSTSIARIDAYYAEIKTQDVSSHSVPGGSDAKVKPFIELLDTLVTTTGNGINVLNENMPTGLGLLDANGRVKATTQFTLLTMFADYTSSGTNFTEYSRLHIYDEDEELFTPVNHEGLLIDYTTTLPDLFMDWPGDKYFKPDQPYVFKPNHQVSLKADVPAVTGSGSTLRVALIGVRERIG
jgi:hypothetical protein